MIYGIKEHVRELLKTMDVHEFQARWAVLEKSVRATKMVEAKSLFRTLSAWRRELLVFVENPADECTERASESDSEEPQTDRSGLSES